MNRPRGRSLRASTRLSAVVLAASAVAALADPVVSYRVVGDAIPEALVATPGDVGRGRAVVIARESSCILCHRVPDPSVRFAGDIGPPLDGVGARLSAGQLRLRLVDSTRLNPETVMPAYHRVAGLERVASAYRDKPLLGAEEIEHAIAYLLTLR